MTEELLYHVDGELVPDSEATVSVRDRGFMYGDAAFETIRAYGGNLFEWEAHLDRLVETCNILQIDHGLAGADLRDRVEETLAANDLEEAYVKLSITRGVQPGTLAPDPEVDPTVVVIVRELPRGGLHGESTWDGPATLQTVKTKKPPKSALPARAKTHNYLNGILARLELQATDADEALVLDTEGYVAEGTVSNVFFVADGALRTPSLEGPILPGITRDVVLELAREEGIPVETGRYTPDDVRSADEVFITGSTREIQPVERVDGIDIGAGSGDRSDGDDRSNGGDRSNGDDRSDGDDRSNEREWPVTELLARLYDERVERTMYER